MTLDLDAQRNMNFMFSQMIDGVALNSGMGACDTFSSLSFQVG